MKGHYFCEQHVIIKPAKNDNHVIIESEIFSKE